MSKLFSAIIISRIQGRKAPGKGVKAMEVQLKKNNSGYYFFEMVAGAHDHQITRVWVNHTLVEQAGQKLRIKTPVSDAWCYKTEKGSLVLRPRHGAIFFVIEVHSGYRGTSEIKKICSPDGELEILAIGQAFYSPLGSIGEISWALVNSDGPIEVYATVTGRRVSNSDYSYRWNPDGTIEEIITDKEIFDLL